MAEFGSDFRGWNSSYSDEPMPLKEMAERWRGLADESRSAGNSMADARAGTLGDCADELEKRVEETAAELMARSEHYRELAAEHHEKCEMEHIMLAREDQVMAEVYETCARLLTGEPKEGQ